MGRFDLLTDFHYFYKESKVVKVIRLATGINTRKTLVICSEYPEYKEFWAIPLKEFSSDARPVILDIKNQLIGRTILVSKACDEIGFDSFYLTNTEFAELHDMIFRCKNCNRWFDFELCGEDDLCEDCYEEAERAAERQSNGYEEW